MHDLMLKKLMALKKGKSEMSEDEKSAKSKVLESLMGEMDKMGAGKLQKVTVAAKDKAGLEKGLEKAKDLVEGKLSPVDAGSLEEIGENEVESDSEEEKGEEAFSEEDIDKQIAELMAKKAAMKRA